MNRFSIYILSIAFCMIFSSCDKQLSEPPANARVEGTAITDQKSAITALNGVYYRFANVTADNVTYWQNHQVPGGMYSGWLQYGFGLSQDEQNNNVNSGFAGSIWSQSYLLITAANAVIDGIQPVPENAFVGDKKKNIIGESRFLRAYGHFRLLMYFSEWFNQSSKNGVLVRDKFTALSEIQKARSTVAESYAFILADLDFAIANAPATNPNYYATKWAAMALKMRVLMTRGLQADFAEVNTLGNTLIQTSGFALEPNLRDIFQTKGLSSKEIILGIRPQPSQELFIYNQSKEFFPGGSNVYAASQKLKDLLQNDPRGSWMVGPTTPYQAYSPNTYYFSKFIPVGSASSQLTETSYALRLSEVYLMMAEATIRTNGGDLNAAKTLIKTVMARAGVNNFSAVDNANTNSDLLLQNYYEVSRNLVGEDGIEWLTLIRLPLNTVKQLKPTILSNIQFYFPVPRSELDGNKLFGVQNTGYGQ